MPSAAGRGNVATRETFQPGDRVRVREDFVPGHMRMPGYIRGKSGIVVSESPKYPFPDAHAHGIHAEDEPTYDVRFRSEDLWGSDADAALVHVIDEELEVVGRAETVRGREESSDLIPP